MGHNRDKGLTFAYAPFLPTPAARYTCTYNLQLYKNELYIYIYIYVYI